EGQIDGYEKRLTSKYNELNNLMLEIAAFNHSEDGEEKTGRQLYGHLFFLEDEIDTIEAELSACKSKKNTIKTKCPQARR
ncbi:MAG: hypothetical protein II266_08415, partial [Clostridia bacterium]|nr:hypothetical protein [Clostridia bacterium]